MNHWPVQDAKARFSELVETALKEGPQMVTRRGIEKVVVVPVEIWKRMTDDLVPEDDRPSLMDLLLHDPRRFELDIPPRGQLKHRDPIDFD